MIETLEDAKQILRDGWEDGVECPCCHQYVKLWRHKINAQIAKLLIDMHHYGNNYVNIFGVLKPKTTMYSIARFWGLIEPYGGEVTEDKKTSGLWRLTTKGRQFVYGEISIPKYAFVFNNKAYRFSHETVTIENCLGNKFSYGELMNADSKGQWL